MILFNWQLLDVKYKYFKISKINLYNINTSKSKIDLDKVNFLRIKT